MSCHYCSLETAQLVPDIRFFAFIFNCRIVLPTAFPLIAHTCAALKSAKTESKLLLLLSASSNLVASMRSRTVCGTAPRSGRDLRSSTRASTVRGLPNSIRHARYLKRMIRTRPAKNFQVSKAQTPFIFFHSLDMMLVIMLPFTRANPYSCSYCDHKCNQSTYLKRHERIHI